MSTQLFLDLDFSEPVVAEESIDPISTLKPMEVRRSALGWMAKQGVAGLAMKVPTRLSQYRTDVAGFWNLPRANKKKGPQRIFVPSHTMIIECRQRREACWPDYAESSTLLPELRTLKSRKKELEVTIRENEPHLRETATLFDEFTEWNYEGSTNEEYRQVCREIVRISKAIYEGTRFEKIRKAYLADFLYLAVPENTVHPHELASGWGLIWVKADMSSEMIVQATAQKCPPENKNHLVQNIASAAAQNVLFANGIHVLDHDVEYLCTPKRRLKKAKPQKAKPGTS